MTNKKNKKVSPDQIEDMLSFVEMCLERSGILFPVEDEYVDSIAAKKLPDHLKNSNDVLRMGARILERGIDVHVAFESDPNIEGALAAAARNGSSISEELLDRMHLDRDQAEAQNEFD